jgi:hypothetical protein
VIHAHFAVPTGALAFPVSRLTGIPYVLTAHLGDVPGGVPEQTAHLFRLVNPLARILWKSAARVTAVSSFVAGLARSPLAQANVTINNLLPGAFDTDRLRKTVEAAAQKPGQTIDMVLERRRQSIPAGRLGTTEEFGAICAFICSQHASYITGQNILADGGAYPGSF